jgi:propanol-preferring alcohol dehydrogenase
MADALPAKFKAVIYDKPGEISTKVVEVDMREAAAGDVLIKL